MKLSALSAYMNATTNTVFNKYLPRVITGICIVFVSNAATADILRDPSGQMTINEMSRYSELEIATDNTRFVKGDKIDIQIRIKNTGYQIMRFYPQLIFPGSVRFLVVDMNGNEIQPQSIPMPNPEESTKAIQNLKGDAVKEIILHPKESFVKSMNLNRLYNLDSGKKYRLSAYYWPNPDNKEYFIRSTNFLNLMIDKKNSAHHNRHLSSHSDHDSPLISPEETVFLFLAAEMRQNWANHFKFLDLPRYITSYDRFASEYIKTPVPQRPHILEKFKNYLMTNPADKLIKFNIIDAVPQHNESGYAQKNSRYKVRVMAIRADRGYSARYEYTYSLEHFVDQSSRSWKIIYVEAVLKNAGANE